MSYRGDRFVAYGDEARSFESFDALEWSELAGIDEATYCEDAWKTLDECHGAAWFDGGYFREEWGGHILRSTDGQDFDEVYEDDQKTTRETRSIAAGRRPRASSPPEPNCDSARSSLPPALAVRAHGSRNPCTAVTAARSKITPSATSSRLTVT